ncbi:MAG: type II toxin-antitoxin system HicA family toxin [Chloroflexi bacterium]|nr:type II toxin-antitoxin system HicA family toxin [Chloroflexota bacterium]
MVRALERAGWEVHRQRGSHVSMKKEGSRFVITVPMHRRDIPKGTLRSIIEDAELTTEEFIALLKDRRP